MLLALSRISFKTGLDEKIRGEVKTIKPSLIEEIKQDIKSTLQDDVRMVVREIEDQKTRAMNLIFLITLYSLES
jgi:AICAR transformylase/IMP cyclohydrolase PurH